LTLFFFGLIADEPRDFRDAILIRINVGTLAAFLEFVQESLTARNAIVFRLGLRSAR
jgi:hypothetical protein